MRQLKHKDKIRFIVDTDHFEKGFETVVEDSANIGDSLGEGFRVMGTWKMICGTDALFQYLHGEHWEFVD